MTRRSHRLRPLLIAIVAAVSVVPPNARAGDAAAAGAVSFRADVAPVLVKHCQACHGPDEAKGRYRLDTFDRLTKSGKSGRPPVTAGKPDASEVFTLIATHDEDERMPQDADPLPAAQVDRVRRWIEQGAAFDGPDPAAPLVSVIPRGRHPAAPHVYPRPVPAAAVAFSPDGAKLAVSGYHEVTVWDPATGKLLGRVGDVARRTFALAYRPDGRVLAVGGGSPGESGEVRLFDAATGALLAAPAARADVVLDVKFSPDGKLLAAAGADHAIHLYDLTDAEGGTVTIGTPRPPIEGHADWVNAVAFSPDGGRVASASRDKSAKVFDVKTGALLASHGEHAAPVFAAAFGPDGAQVLSAGADRKIHAWTAADGKKAAEIGGFDGDVLELLADGGGTVFSCSTDDATARRHRIADGSLVRAYTGHADWVNAIAYHAGTNRLAAGGFDGRVRVWDAETGEAVCAFVAAPGYQAPAGE